MRCLLSLTVCAALATGCAGSVDGQVDDESVPWLLSGFFYQLDENKDAFGVSLILLSVVNGCDGATKRQEFVNEAFETQKKDLKDADSEKEIEKINDKFADEVVAYDEQHAPTDFWSVTVNVNVEDDKDVAESFDLGDDEDAAKASVTICRTNDFPRNKDGTVREDRDCFVATKGDLEITEYEQDTKLAFTADVKLKDTQNLDKQKGDVVINGSGSYCEGLEEAVDDFNDILTDD
jgi:hypothetical protein